MECTDWIRKFAVPNLRFGRTAGAPVWIVSVPTGLDRVRVCIPLPVNRSFGSRAIFAIEIGNSLEVHSTIQKGGM